LKNAAVYLRSQQYLSDTALISAPLPAPDARTDSLGRYYLDSLTDGGYVVEISGESIGVAAACTLGTRSEKLLTMPDLAAAPFGSIRGSVQFTGGTPVCVRVYGLQRAVIVDALSGTYLVERVPRGSYTVQIKDLASMLPPIDVADVNVVSDSATLVGPVQLQTFEGENYAQWLHSQTIHLVTTVAGANVADTVINFPVLLRLDQTNMAFSQSFDGCDIRFAKTDGTHLRYELETWDAGLQRASVWVRVDTIYGNDTTDIVMYWGRENVADFSSGSQVFGTAEGYLGVWHLRDSADASGGGHTLITSSSATAPSADTGLIGGCMRYDDSQKYWAVPATSMLDADNSFSISVWARWQGPQLPGYNRIVSNKLLWNDSVGFEILTISGNDRAVDIRAQDSIGYAPVNVIDSWMAQDWHNVTLVWNKGQCSIFVDGTIISSPLINAYNAPNDLVFGSNADHTGPAWSGGLDEIRLTRGQLSAGWIRLCYENQKPQPSLCQFY
jgi:biopolymer transport protein ExbB